MDHNQLGYPSTINNGNYMGSEQISASAEQGKSLMFWERLIKQQRSNYDYCRIMNDGHYALIPSALNPINPAEMPNLSANHATSASPPAAGVQSKMISGSLAHDYALNYSSSVANYAIISPANTVINGCPANDDHHAAARAKIAAHPAYPRLVLAYLNCNKVGAPPEIALELEQLCSKYRMLDSQRQSSATSSNGIKLISDNISDSCTSDSPAAMQDPLHQSADPELDNFMEAYCNILWAYHEELAGNFRDAICFMNKIELKLSELVNQHDLDTPNTNNGTSMYTYTYPRFSNPGYYDEDVDAMKAHLKEQLLGKYSSYIASLKHEFLKKKKKGKLPKDARQKLLDWWEYHSRWPYPSEGEKVALAKATGLDQKQINNWFINQRKRHWKPSQDVNA